MWRIFWDWQKKTTRAWDIPSMVKRQHLMCSTIHNKSKQITEVELLKMTCKDWHNFFLLLYLLTCFLSFWLVRHHHHSSCSLSVIAFFACKIHPQKLTEKHSLLHPAHCCYLYYSIPKSYCYIPHAFHPQHIQRWILMTSLKLQSSYYSRPGGRSKFGSSVCIPSPQILALVTLCKKKGTSDNIIQLPHQYAWDEHAWGSSGEPMGSCLAALENRHGRLVPAFGGGRSTWADHKLACHVQSSTVTGWPLTP